jgi:hypothetical protein
MLRETDKRDNGQVVLHWSKKILKAGNWKGNRKSDHYLVMVDQLWLWIFGGKITSKHFESQSDSESRHCDYEFSAEMGSVWLGL